MYIFIISGTGRRQWGGGGLRVHSYPLSRKMTSVLIVQALKLRLPASLPLSGSVCGNIRLLLAPDSEALLLLVLLLVSHLSSEEGWHKKAGRGKWWAGGGDLDGQRFYEE